LLPLFPSHDQRIIKGIQKKQKLSEIKKPDIIKEVCNKCLQGLIKEVPYRNGKVRVCDNIKCDYRETEVEK